MTTLNLKISSAAAIAPATCANVAVGYDILGFAIEALHDRVEVVRRSDDQLRVSITNNDNLIKAKIKSSMDEAIESR